MFRLLTIATLRCSLCRLLNNPTWIPHLVQGLMLEPSHPRNLQDSPLPPTDPATKARIQCDYAECLAQVSLFGPGRVALLRDAERESAPVAEQAPVPRSLSPRCARGGATDGAALLPLNGSQQRRGGLAADGGGSCAAAWVWPPG